MGVKEKEKSLLEIAMELLKKKKKPQKIDKILEEVMSTKGLSKAQIKELAPQFLLDFMQSGYFIYCGDDCWDLKERQPISILDKDGGDYEAIFFDNEDVKENELKDDDSLLPIDKVQESDADDEEDDNDDDKDDDLSREFENPDEEDADIVEVSNEEDIDEEDEDEDLSDEFFEDEK